MGNERKIYKVLIQDSEAFMHIFDAWLIDPEKYIEAVGDDIYVTVTEKTADNADALRVMYEIRDAVNKSMAETKELWKHMTDKERNKFKKIARKAVPNFEGFRL